MLPCLISFWDFRFSEVVKGLLRQMLYLQSQWIDPKYLNGVCLELIFKFCFSEFCFQFEFFFNFDFRMHKTHPKGFVFEILFIGDYSSISLKCITFQLLNYSISKITFLPRNLVYRYLDKNYAAVPTAVVLKMASAFLSYEKLAEKVTLKVETSVTLVDNL